MDILNVHWLRGCQEPKPPDAFGWKWAYCSVTRRTDHVLPSSFMAKPKENTQTAWLQCDHSNLVRSPHSVSCEMRLIQSWLQSEPESDCMINTFEDGRTFSEHEERRAFLSNYDITDIHAAMSAQAGFHHQNRWDRVQILIFSGDQSTIWYQKRGWLWHSGGKQQRANAPPGEDDRDRWLWEKLRLPSSTSMCGRVEPGGLFLRAPRWESVKGGIVTPQQSN